MNLDQSLLKDIQKYIKSNYIEELTFKTRSRRMQEPLLASTFSTPAFDEIHDFKTDSSWQNEVFRFIDKKEKLDPEVYKKAFISKQTFSKIRTNTNYHPDKDTAIKMCIGLELNEKESLDLLAKAGYTLSNSIKKDIVIRYFIAHKTYDIVTINNALYDLNLELIKC